MIKIESVYDLFSLLVLFINLYVIFTLDIVAIIGFLLVILIQTILKFLTTGLQPSFIFKRPNGAKNCGLFNTGGLVDDHSGFPSGHMCSISFIMYYLLLKSNKVNFSNIILYNIPILLVAIGRYMKGCHNIIQILTGSMIGYWLAYLLYTNRKDILNMLTKIC
jgi:membrane-associated phospholipid phosphatase